MDEPQHHLSVTQGDCPRCGKVGCWGSKRSFRGFHAFLCRHCSEGLFVMALYRELNDFFGRGEKSD